ncbi:MAG: hypothetical protein ACR2PM_15045 [Hyphomicrobiales bacterium]
MHKTETVLSARPTRLPLAFVLAAGLAGLLLAGCSGGESFEYTAVSEIPEGQGLVTGPEGELTIIKYDPSAPSTIGSTASTSAPAPQPTVTSTSGITEAVTPE